MRPLAIRAATAVSAMGRGRAAMLDALRARRGGLRPCDFAGVTRGFVGQVEDVEAHTLSPSLQRFDCRNNRLADIALRTDGFADTVAEARARHGAARIAVVVGTSTSGVLSAEEAYRAREASDAPLPDSFDYAHTHDLFSLARFVRAALGLRGPAITVSTACASSARSFVDAAHLIASGACDAAVVGGADSLCRMTLRGFASLDLVSARPCRPCDADRDGISVGEAAGFALIEKARDAENAPALLGFGCAADAHHISTPHPEAVGAVRAMQDALRAAGLAPGDIDYINLHGTGTRTNDAMEDVAVTRVFGDDTPCSSTKGWSGHTMGSSGILEAVIALLCIETGFIPGSLGTERLDPTFRARVALANEAMSVRRVMSNSFGFGGINCSLVLGRAA